MAAKKRLVDALRDPDPPAVEKAKKAEAASREKAVKTRKARKKTAKKATKKKQAPKTPWPEGWVLKTVRCYGVTAKGTQCNRRAKPPKKVCGAHKGHTHRFVLAELKKQAKAKEEAAEAESRGAGGGSSEEKKGKPHPLSVAPDDRRCNKTLYPNSKREKRCSRWTIEIEDGAYDDYCVTHSKHPRAKQAREKSQEKGKAGLEARNQYVAAANQPVFNGELKSQDDVAAARLALMRKLEAGAIGATQANVLLSALKDTSQHVERYGTHQGAEGGAGVLRLLPGTKLAEMDQEIDYVMTKADLEAIEAGLAKDEKAGVPTPVEMDEIIFRYLGKTTRKRDRSRNFEE